MLTLGHASIKTNVRGTARRHGRAEVVWLRGREEEEEWEAGMGRGREGGSEATGQSAEVASYRRMRQVRIKAGP
jgi:hypothetical protein